MSESLANIVAPTDLGLTDDGQLFVYISDALTDIESASKSALEWACGAVNDEGVKEHNLALTFNLPEAVDELLEFYNEGAEDEKQIPVDKKPKFDSLRAQLIEAVALLDRVQYKY